MALPSTLIVIGGLPGTGKTALAEALAAALDAVHLRIDTIEQALRDVRAAATGVGPAGYVVAYAIAEDNLRLGRSVVADCVNPLTTTRLAWKAVAERAGVALMDVELVCSDEREHRRRVESRAADIARFSLPTWSDVQARAYEPWTSERVRIDTACRSVEECVVALHGLLLRGRGTAAW